MEQACEDAGHPFRRRHRLRHNREYQAAYASRARKARGPLVVFARANGLNHPRLGLSVGRRVGNAVVRNRMKRMIREAFRLEMARLPIGFDLVVNLRPHLALPLAAYRRLLVDLAQQAAGQADRRPDRHEG